MAKNITLTQEQLAQLLTMAGAVKAMPKETAKKAEKKPSKKAVDGMANAKAVKGMPGVKSYTDRGWTWYGGDTKPHKDKLKAMGCRYSGRRQQWYKVA